MMFDQSITSKYRTSDYIVNRHCGIDLHHTCDMDSFGRRVKARRIDLGLSQEVLAKRCGLSQTTISDIERGRNDGSREIVALSRGLKTTPEWLKYGNTTPPERPDCAAPATAQPQLSADEQMLLEIYRGLSPAAQAGAITEMEVLQVRDKRRADPAAPERPQAPPKDPPSDLCRDRRAQ